MKKLIIIFLGLSVIAPGYSQDKIEPRVDIQYTYTQGRQPIATALIRKRIDRRYYPMPGIQVKIYFNEEISESKIGEMVTNEKGLVAMDFPERLIKQWDSLSTFELFAVLEATDSTEEVSESITVAKARLIVKGQLRDDERLVMAGVEQFTDGQWSPVSGVELKGFVKRDFGQLRFGEEAYETDESGLVEALFEMDIPGNEQGKITIGAFVEEHADYGTLYGYDEVNWGTPTVDSHIEFNKRSLWATRDKTPLWLLIFPNLVILGVWGAIAYLVWQIYQLKKLASKK